MKYRFYILVTLYVALASSRFLRLLRAPNSCDIEDEEGRSFSRYFSSLMRRSARLPRSAFHYSRMIWEASEAGERAPPPFPLLPLVTAGSGERARAPSPHDLSNWRNFGAIRVMFFERHKGNYGALPGRRREENITRRWSGSPTRGCIGSIGTKTSR